MEEGDDKYAREFLYSFKKITNHRLLMQPLFRSSPVFREAHMDYHKCSKALHYWNNLSSQEASFRTQEYSVLLQELKQGLLQSISTFLMER